MKDHQVTLESGVIVRLRNSKVLVFTKLISFYSKFALSCRFKRTFVTGHGHIILHVNKKIGKLLLTIFLSLMIHSACGLVLAKSWNNLYIFFTLKYLNEKTLFVVFCSWKWKNNLRHDLYFSEFFLKKDFFPLKIRCVCLSKSVLVYSIILRRRFSDNLWFPSGNW